MVIFFRFLSDSGATLAFILKVESPNARYFKFCRTFSLDAARLLSQSAAARFPHQAGTPFHQPWLFRHSYAKVPQRMCPLRRDLLSATKIMILKTNETVILLYWTWDYFFSREKKCQKFSATWAWVNKCQTKIKKCFHGVSAILN